MILTILGRIAVGFQENLYAGEYSEHDRKTAMALILTRFKHGSHTGLIFYTILNITHEVLQEKYGKHAKSTGLNISWQ